MIDFIGDWVITESWSSEVDFLGYFTDMTCSAR